MSGIKIDKRNYRKHSDRNKSLINKSLSECGAGRSILIDNENSIVAGNGIYEQSQKLGIPIRVIETDGTELIAVKRTDLATDDEKRKQLAVMDNSTSDSSEFDFEFLSEDFNPSELMEMGINDLVGMEDAESEMPELASGDKAPFQQMAFTLADNQVEAVKEAINRVKQSEKYKYVETFGNTNSNGNALFCIIESWLNDKC